MNTKTIFGFVTISINLISGLSINSNNYHVPNGPIAEYCLDDFIYGNVGNNPWDFIPSTDNQALQTKPNPIPEEAQTKPNPIPEDAQTKSNPNPEEVTQTNPLSIKSSEGASISEQKNTRMPTRRQFDFDNDPQFNGQKVNSETFWDAARTVPSIFGWIGKM